MKMNFDKKTTLLMVEKYYREKLGIKGKATCKISVDWTGYGMSESKDCIVDIKICGKMNIVGQETDTIVEVNDQELENAVKYCMEQEGYSYQSFRLNKGLTTKSVGYGTGESTEEKPYFKGIQVFVKEKENGNVKGVKNLKLYKGCLIVVDMVNGFVTEGVLHDEEIARIIPRQIELIKEAKANNKLIIFLKDNHTKDSVEFRRFGNTEHCLKNTKESELVKELKSYEGQEGTISIPKNSTSFMEAPGFRKLMEEQTELEEFDIAGCCTDICVVNGAIALANYLDEWNRPHTIRVHLDAIATYGEKTRQNYVEAAELLMEQQGIELVKKK